jgi:FAD/FMN-containing dehydrogenase
MAHRKSRTLVTKEAKIQSWSKLPDKAFEKSKITRETAIRLENATQFKLVWRWDASYDKDRQEFDPAFQEYPILIGYPQTAWDIAILLDFSRDAGPDHLPVVCRSGGHSTAGYSVVTDGIVIDMSLFDSVTVDAVSKRATVGPGVSFETLNKALDQYGLHVPGGECEDVCIGGYMQGGGYGFTSREFGMNCDNVERFTMLTYDSLGAHVVTASPTVNPRLFWAARGGTGNNFGVLLDVTYRLQTLGTLWGFGIKWTNLQDAPAALLAMQNGYMKVGASPKLGHLPVIMVQKGDAGASLGTYGLYDGTRAQGLAAIKPLLAIGSAKLVLDQSNSYMKLNEILLPDPNLPPNVTSFPPEVKQSAYISQPMDLAGCAAIVNYFGTRPNNTNAVFFEPYGGVINSYPANGNAFIHRDAYMDIYVDSFWFKDSDRKAAEAWLDGYVKIFDQYSNGQQYQNYPRRNTPNYPEAFWGPAYPALQQIKAEYDPLNVFKFPMGIVPAAGAVAAARPSKARAAFAPGSKKAPSFESFFEKYKKRQEGSSRS